MNLPFRDPTLVSPLTRTGQLQPMEAHSTKWFQALDRWNNRAGRLLRDLVRVRAIHAKRAWSSVGCPTSQDPGALERRFPAFCAAPNRSARTPSPNHASWGGLARLARQWWGALAVAEQRAARHSAQATTACGQRDPAWRKFCKLSRSRRPRPDSRVLLGKVRSLQAVVPHSPVHLEGLS